MQVFGAHKNIIINIEHPIVNATTQVLVVSLPAALTASADKNAEFITVVMSCVKLSSSTPDDGQTGLKRTYNFTAYRNAAGGASLANHSTTIMVHDSLAA